MTAEEILHNTRALYPAEIDKAIAASFAFMPQQRKNVTENLDNELKTEIIASLLLNFSIDDINLIRQLLNEEVNTGNSTGNFDNLRLLCSYLFSLGRLEDVFLINDAKFNSKYTVSGQYLDWQLITVGHPINEVICYVKTQIAQNVAMELQHKALPKRLAEYAENYTDDDITRYRNFDLPNYYYTCKDRLNDITRPQIAHSRKHGYLKARDIINQSRMDATSGNKIEIITDANLLLRTEITELLLADFSIKDISLIRLLLEEELKCEKATQTHHNLYTLCFFLFELQQPQDFFLLYEAKFGSRLETGASIEWEMLTLGLPVTEIVNYVRNQLSRDSRLVRRFPGINDELNFLQNNCTDLQITAFAGRLRQQMRGVDVVEVSRTYNPPPVFSFVPGKIEPVINHPQQDVNQWHADSDNKDEKETTRQNTKLFAGAVLAFILILYFIAINGTGQAIWTDTTKIGIIAVVVMVASLILSPKIQQKTSKDKLQEPVKFTKSKRHYLQQAIIGTFNTYFAINAIGANGGSSNNYKVTIFIAWLLFSGYLAVQGWLYTFTNEMFVTIDDKGILIERKFIPWQRIERLTTLKSSGGILSLAIRFATSTTNSVHIRISDLTPGPEMFLKCIRDFSGMPYIIDTDRTKFMKADAIKLIVQVRFNAQKNIPDDVISLFAFRPSEPVDDATFDINSDFRTEIIEQLLSDFSAEDNTLIKALFHEEMKSLAAIRYNHHLHQLCYYFFMIASLENVFLIYDAFVTSGTLEWGNKVPWQMLSVNHTMEEVCQYVAMEFLAEPIRREQYPDMLDVLHFYAQEQFKVELECYIDFVKDQYA